MPAPFRPADPAEVAAALERFRSGSADQDDVRLLVRHFLAVLGAQAPGRSVELRVPPYAAVQVVGGLTHKRGRPPAVVEAEPDAWIALATGDLAWQDAVGAGRVTATGERSDLSPYLPLLG